MQILQKCFQISWDTKSVKEKQKAISALTAHEF